LGIRATLAHLYLGALLVVEGCTDVTIQTGDQIDVSRSFGLGSIRFGELSRPLLVRTTGFGVLGGATHLAIGWMDEKLIVFPDPSKCQLLVYVDQPQDLEKVVTTLEHSGIPPTKFCVATGEHHE
jgi:hypothetical protein